MNVLIVDDDKPFGKSLTKLLKSNSNIEKVNYFDNYEKSSNFLKESSSSYAIKIINLDSINSNDFYIQDESKYIVYSQNSKTIKKHINNPSIQRVFQKPFNLNYFQNYLNKYCDVKNEAIKDEPLINTLTKIGFSLSCKGTLYLSDSISYAIKHNSKSLSNIFNEIGKNYHISGKQVLWAINNSINRLVHTTYEKKYAEFFKIYDGRKPTPKFIIDYFITLNK